MNKLFDIEGKTALVTGGSRDIGEMITTGLVRNCMNISICSRNADARDMAPRWMSRLKI